MAEYTIDKIEYGGNVYKLQDSVSGYLDSNSTLNAAKLSGAIPSAVTATTQASTDNSTKLATTAYVTTAIDNLPEPMVFKGSVGTGGTVTTLPTASASNEGWTYKVITALSSPAAKVGDTVISNGSSWVVIPSGDEPSGTVTSVGVSNGGGLSVSGSPVTSSGTITVSHADTSSQASSSNSGRTYIQSVTLDTYGHVTGLSTATETVTDTNTHRPIQMDGTEILGNNTTALNLKAGSNVSLSNSSGTVTIAATDTTYESKAAASGGTAVSLVTTGEKYTWNNKIGATTPTIATDTGTSTITLASAGKYKLTAGGGSVIFTMPTIPTVNYPVTSVNSKTGAVSLTASDVGALPLTGGSVTGPVSFGDSVTLGDDLTTSSKIVFNYVNSGTTYTSNIQMIGYNGTSSSYVPRLTFDKTTIVENLQITKSQISDFPTIPTIPSNNITGSGTNGKIAKFTGTYTIGDGYGVTDNTTATAVTSTDTNLITGRTLYNAGYTKNTGTVTGVKVNGTTKSPTSGVVDIGTVATSDTNTTYALSGALSSHKFTSTLTAGGSGSGTSASELTLAEGTGISITDDTTNKKMTIALSSTIPSITLNGSSTTSPSFYAPTTAGTSGQILQSNGSGAPTWANAATNTTWWGTSSTTASTAAKVVTCADFSLTIGAVISVYFSIGNTADAPTLNVNSTGAKAIYVGNSVCNGTTNVLKWSAYTVLTFMYDGTYWKYISSVSAGSVAPSRGAGTWYGYSYTSASLDTKISAISNFVLTKGAVVAITFAIGNSSDSLNLNVSDTGSKSVYRGTTAVSGSNPLKWSDGETLTFMYDGTYWNYISTSSNIGEKNWAAPSAVSCQSGKWYKVAEVTLDPGIWFIDCNALFPKTNATGTRQIRVTTETFTNGTTTSPDSYGNITNDVIMGANTAQYPQSHFPVDISSQTTFMLAAYQGSNSSMNVTGRMYATRIK